MKYLKKYEAFDSELGKNLKKHLDLVVKKLEKVYPEGKIKMSIVDDQKNKYGDLMPKLEIETPNNKIWLYYDYSNGNWKIDTWGGANIYALSNYDNVKEEFDDTIETLKHEINKKVEKFFDEVEDEDEDMFYTKQDRIEADRESKRLNDELTARQQHYHR